MTTTTVERNRWYPSPPPGLDGENADAYTDRLTGCLGEDKIPYDHDRNRQCSIGWHSECSDPEGERCKCPCHQPSLTETQIAAVSAALSPETRAAAAKLAELYDLPDGTAHHVMAIVRAQFQLRAGLPEAALRGGIAYAFASAYGSRTTNDFLTDVVDIYRAAEAGKLPALEPGQ